MTVGDRLKEARERRFSSAAEAARAMGIKVAAYNHHENGTRNLTPETAKRYADFFKVNVEWMLYRRGPRDRHQPSTGTPLDGFDELSPEDQQLIVEMVARLLKRRGS